MAIIDKYKFEHHGGVGCSNSGYHLRRTKCCESYYVEDNELFDIYIDPNDLSKRISSPEWPLPCPFCGSLDWWDSFEVLDVVDIPDAWRRVCHER
jgi:hypothetical protein